MNATERQPASVTPERPQSPVLAPLDLKARIQRTNMMIVPPSNKLDVLMGHSGAFVQKDIYFQSSQKENNIKEFSRPSIGRVKEVISRFGEKVIRRFRRPSRCNGMHNVVEDPCGSPRCRSTKGKETEFKSQSSEQSNQREQRRRVSSELKKLAVKTFRRK